MLINNIKYMSMKTKVASKAKTKASRTTATAPPASKSTTKQYQVCKNRICADRRIIKHALNGKKNSKNFRRHLKYYFLCSESKRMYELSIPLFATMKDKIGYLISVEYSYRVEQHRHIMSAFLVYFLKFDKDTINNPLWNNSGATHKSPFVFNLIFSQNTLNRVQDKTVKDTAKSVNTKRFQTYIRKVQKSIQQDFKSKMTLDAYKDTYENLLKKYYSSCVTADADIFSIKPSTTTMTRQ